MLAEGGHLDLPCGLPIIRAEGGGELILGGGEDHVRGLLGTSPGSVCVRVCVCVCVCAEWTENGALGSMEDVHMG